MKTLLKILMPLLVLGALTAGDEAGGTAGAYLRMPGDARSAAIGNAATAVTGDANMVNGNPAILPTLTERQFSSSFQFLTLDRSYQSIAFGVPLPPNAAMNVSWIHAGVDNIAGRNFSNDYTYEYVWSQNAFVIGFGIRIAEWIAIGVSGKILSDQLAYSSSSGFSADIGVIVTPFRHLQLGFVVKDLSGKTTWDTSGENYSDFQTRRTDYFPGVYHMGISYTLLERYLLSFSYKYSEDIEPTWHTGVEARVGDGIFIRAGVDNGIPVFGFGTFYKLWNTMSTRMDYAFGTSRVHEGISHLFTWLFYF